MKQHKKIAERTRRRAQRVRRKINGSADCPRLSVFRSSRFIYAQLIDDEREHTLLASSSLALVKEGRIQPAKAGNRAAAKEVGLDLARRAQELGVLRARFDRGAYKFHGRVKSLAEGVTEGGLKLKWNERPRRDEGVNEV